MPEESFDPETRPPLPDAGGNESSTTPAGPTAVVGIGGSAGALDGYERFFLSLPPGSGLAFVVVPHLDPEARGLMPEILARCTDLPVVPIEDGTPVRADHVHVLPPGHSLSLMGGTLLLEDLGLAQGRVIDAFFESLAADQGERAVGVILSGTGTDGTRGVAAIRQRGGRVVVQDPGTAEYPSMPGSAAGTGLADAVLPAEELAPRLYRLVTTPPGAEDTDTEMGAALQKILRLVRAQCGHDFSGYKTGTLLRRIDRRMKAHRIEDAEQYLRFLQRSPEEVEALFGDFTINVTSFFRDAEAFAELAERLRELILTGKSDFDPFRVWIVGCSTGEEAYSVAIVLHELMEELGNERPLRVQIFATDIDQAAVEKARLGVYPSEIAYVVSPERLERYFTARDGGYAVKPEIRDLLVFALHNTFGDPPFTRLDLLCCRNMLIYLRPELQKRVMTLFHFALRPGGLLFLGASETVGAERDQFAPLSVRWKLFRRREGAPGPLLLGGVEGAGALSAAASRHSPPPARAGRPTDAAGRAQRLLLAEYTPPAVVVNEGGEILFVNGHTARYLELPAGHTQVNVFEMARGSLRYELPAAVREAATRQEITRGQAHVEVEGVEWYVDLTVRPLSGQGERLFLITFQERPTGTPLGPLPGKTDQVLALERELQHTRESLQATLEEMEVAVEEFRSTNEELQTANEELQSSNEELTTSKEEYQSLNEELITINAEHERVIENLAQAGDDVKNLLDSAGIAAVFLDNSLRIKRFTPRITRVINLMPVDEGRPITDINTQLRYDHLIRDIGGVIDTLTTFETQVQTQDGQWYLMRVSPYRTSDNFIDGVVVAFTNIDLIKGLEREREESLAYADAVLNSLADPVIVLDHRLRVVTANRALYELLRTSASQVRGERLSEIDHYALDLPDLEGRLRDLIATGEPLRDYVIDLNVPYGGTRKMKAEAQPVVTGDGEGFIFVLKLEDVTNLIHRVAHEGEDITGDTPDAEA